MSSLSPLSPASPAAPGFPAVGSDPSAVPESVRTEVLFTVDTGETPVALVRRPGAGPDERSGRFEAREIEVRDGRPIADRLELDRHGFVLRDVETAVGDFADDEEVRRVYYPETTALVARETGASTVLAFDHTRRIDDTAAQERLGIRGPAQLMHNDFTAASCARRVRDLLPAREAERRLEGRFGSVNVWRPLRGPVRTSPLAICEYDSISDGDLIAAERRYEGRTGTIYHMAFNPAQRWYYFPRMTPDEAVLLKCYDSAPDAARWTGHGAFPDPNSPPGAAPRESIEVRTLVFWD